MRLESNVNLLVAALDLKLVRLVRRAMNAGDADGHGAGSAAHPAPVIEPRKRIHPEPHIEPRPRIHPEPAFEPRPIHRPDAIGAPPCTPCCPPATPAEPAAGKSSSSRIEPPWKVLPWERDPAAQPRPIQKVKVVIGPPDMVGKGNVIDLFI